MDKEFWHERWKNNQIAFHESKANPLLVKYINKLSPVKGSRVFLPLCGKTLDIHWLLANGFRVAGAELSKIAIEQLFSELAVVPKITRVGQFDRYSAKNIDIYVGDIFDLSGEALGKVDAIYDRAALVAFPEKMRIRYAKHLMEITQCAPQLLICFEYDQSLMDGPPFSIIQKEVQQHYGENYKLTLLSTADVVGGLKGQREVKETAYLLSTQNGT